MEGIRLGSASWVAASHSWRKGSREPVAKAYSTIASPCELNSLTRAVVVGRAASKRGSAGCCMRATAHNSMASPCGPNSSTRGTAASTRASIRGWEAWPSRAKAHASKAMQWGSKDGRRPVASAAMTEKSFGERCPAEAKAQASEAMSRFVSSPTRRAALSASLSSSRRLSPSPLPPSAPATARLYVQATWASSRAMRASRLAARGFARAARTRGAAGWPERA
mmetsp:Transcript_40618/g.115013  ORF Transcript_40618/g.115013 Transcript_40618/m.115013 type:complete len:223 (-) Transcript_40618:815-1483(-)